MENQKPKVLCEVYSRVVGYLRPVQYWNKARKQEFSERKLYKIPGKYSLKS